MMDALARKRIIELEASLENLRELVMVMYHRSDPKTEAYVSEYDFTLNPISEGVINDD